MTVTIPMTGPRGPRRQEPDDGQGQGYAGAGSPAGSSGPQGSPVLRLLPPRRLHAAALRLTPDQQAAVDVVQGSGPVLVPGAPGTGKTTVLVEAAVQRVVRDGVDPERILILAPTRLAADFLRDRFTARLDRSLSTTPARTWASYAFDLIRRAKAEGVIPLPRPPRLLSGPEQDLIIKELLEGHRIPGLELPWPADLDGALETRGFRQEVRQLFDRIIESGRTAGDLVRLADDCGRPDWKAAAALYAEYRDVLDLRMPEAFDPAGIITAARQIFQDAPEFLAAERARLQVVLVDDIQEANPAIFELLADIAAGRDCYITSSPDTVVQGFRGARPDLVAELPRLLSAQAPVLERPLWHAHGLAPAVANAWMNVAGRISQRAGGQLARRLEPPARSGQPDPGDSPGNVEAHLVPTPVHELRYVAQRILDQHINHNRDLADIAVIVRNGGQVSELQRYLSGQGIPVQVPVAESAVRDEVAVRPLLDAFAIALDPGLLTPEAAVSLLTSRIGGATSIELRRLRQSLRREELLGGGGRASDVLLVEALLEPGALGALGIEGRAARRTARMIQAGRDAAGLPGANAESVLWALWSSTGLSTAWTATALAGGPHGARADRDLDAMMALFHTAERYVDQMPGAGPEQFLEYLLNQELPMDTLAARAQLDDAVELMTPASAAGRQWPVVIIAGLQEAVWPNTRLRGELLGSTLYADAVEHGPEYALQRDPLSRLRDIRYDELRSFSTAVSRARELLVCTAVSSEDDQPSSFLDFVAPLEPGEEGRVFTRVERPMTLRALVAELRQHAQLVGDAAQFGDGVGNLKDGTAQADEAARVLAHLASVEPPVPGAHPGTWWGLAPLTSTEAVVPPGGTVSVSPSKVETVQKSPLDWFVQAAGGEPATDFARSLGTLVHAIAQDMPDASGSEYVAELVRRWPALGMKDNWEGKLDFQRAEAMVRKLAQYVLTMRSESRSLLGVEQDFEVALGEVTVDEAAPREALLRGQVDRLEIDGEGRLVVVDLKTGKRQPGKDELSRHPQLGAYQAAVLAGGFDAGAGGARSSSGGAVLAQLGTSAVNPAIQQQEPLDPRENWALDMVTEAAAVMGGSEFTARHDPAKGSHGGHGCRLPEVCPLCVRGRQVTE